jgi:hypothetical protein
VRAFCLRRAPFLLVVVGLSLLNSGCAPDRFVDSLAELENARLGTRAWQISNPARHREIEGFASQASVNRGEEISFFVSTPEPTYAIEIFRMGWYGGTGGRVLMAPVVRTGKMQTMPEPDPQTGRIECQWVDPYVLRIPNSTDPADWPSGIYLAKLTAGASGKQSYIIFVVRDDARRSDLLFQSSVTTFEAYNNWGGKSLYTNPRAHKVSFNRPYRRGFGSGDFFLWELSMLRFLEREGYDVTYSTDVDTHQRGDLLFTHRGFLSVGHDEYWSWQMRDNVEAARDAGVSVGFFGANTAYWQIRLEPSPITGELDRTIVCYKDAKLDPVANDPHPDNRRRTTTQFRLPPVNRAEDALIGMMYESANISGDIVIEDASNWVFEGTGLQNGDHLSGLLGYEVDRMFGNAPQGTQRLAHSPYLDHGNQRYSDMTVYTAPAGSTVVAVGSMQWNWGLDESLALRGRTFSHPAVQQATRNILRRFGALPITGAASATSGAIPTSGSPSAATFGLSSFAAVVRITFPFIRP